jgi:hypothetical protein
MTILGMAPDVLVHVLISLVGIASGLVVMAGLVPGKRLDGWTTVFLATTVATSVTGFLLPAEHFMPSHVLGILSLVTLTVAIAARYQYEMLGWWRPAYVVSAVVSLYFNVFVLVVQSFMKIPFLWHLAPTQTEPPFAITQAVVLVLFIVLGIFATLRFKPGYLAAA